MNHTRTSVRQTVRRVTTMAGIVVVAAASTVAAQEHNAPLLAFGVAGGFARAGGLSGGSGYHVLGTHDDKTTLRWDLSTRPEAP